MDGLLWFLLYAALFYLMMRFGCGAHMIHGHGGHGERDSRDRHAGHDRGDTDQRDPVCGMSVAADQGYGKMHRGTLYRFCSRKCLDQFEANPERYASQSLNTGGKV